MAIAYAEFCDDKVLVDEVDSCAYLHICVLRADDLLGKAKEVCADGNAAEQGCFFLLLLLLSLQREAGQANQKQ